MPEFVYNVEKINEDLLHRKKLSLIDDLMQNYEIFGSDYRVVDNTIPKSKEGFKVKISPYLFQVSGKDYELRLEKEGDKDILTIKGPNLDRLIKMTNDIRGLQSDFWALEETRSPFLTKSKQERVLAKAG